MKHSAYLIISALVLLCSCGGKEKNVANGTFEATEVTVSAQTAGPIMVFDVREGDAVTEGQVIALIDSVQLVLQRSQLLQGINATLASRPDIPAQQAALRQQIENACYERDRVKRLLESGAATRKQLDNAEQAIAALQSQLTGLTAQLNTQTKTLNGQSETTRAQIAAINDQLARCRVVSPLNGTVLVKYSEAGEMAAPGKPMVKIADLDKIYLRAYVTSTQLADLSLGKKVTVTADYGGGKTADYEGTIDWISSQSEFTPKTIQTEDTRANLVYAIKVGVKNDGKLKIGLNGYVNLDN